MRNNNKSYLVNSLSKIADGKIQPEPSGVVKEIIKNGYLSKQQVAAALGVPEQHIRKVAAGLKERQLQQLCEVALQNQPGYQPG